MDSDGGAPSTIADAMHCELHLVELPDHKTRSITTGYSRWRWAMLTILCLDICVSYLPYYAFVPILPQAMQVFGVDEAALNLVCILYAFAYIPGAFVTGPTLSRLGCRWSFVLSSGLTMVGCAVRCGPALVHDLVLSRLPHVTALCGSFTEPALDSFTWLIVGQGLCALGQPFLVNSTSQMIAEWFAPSERPAAAMLSNFMNFLGSSMSFMMSPLMVADLQGSLITNRGEVMHLLRVQFAFSLFSFAVTAVLYQPSPLRAPLLTSRPRVSFLAEVRGFFGLRDFWIVNIQFMFYVAVCNAFDAVEGSLLEHYGYRAALSSWTAVSCAVTATIATVIEAILISSPASYKPALIMVNGLLASSLFIGFACLHFRVHEAGFVIAVGIMGLSTPGWACSFELGSEVCFPAKEGSVSSFLEAGSNLLSIGGIVLVQRLIDRGLGAFVLLLMGFCALFSSALLSGLSGRLRRCEAEAAEAEAQFDERSSELKVPNMDDETQLAQLIGARCNGA